jgi:hypothetical protein
VDPTKMMNWLARVVRLDSTAFDEIKLDPAGLVSGLIAVALTNLVIGIGTYLYAEFADLSETSDLLLRSVLLGTIIQTVVWVAWPGVTHLLINSFYRATSDFQQLVATMGFAYVPAVISFLILITFLDWPMAILGMVATFVLSQYAIAAASNAASSQITMANLAGFAAFALLMGVVTEVTSGDGPGDYPMANGIWFLDSVASETADTLGTVADLESLDGTDPEDLEDLAREQCEEQVDEGLLPEGSCDAFD